MPSKTASTFNPINVRIWFLTHTHYIIKPKQKNKKRVNPLDNNIINSENEGMEGRKRKEIMKEIKGTE